MCQHPNVFRNRLCTQLTMGSGWDILLKCSELHGEVRIASPFFRRYANLTEQQSPGVTP